MTQKKAFVSIKFYKKGSPGTLHLYHVYRIKTVRQLENKFEAGGASMEELLVDYSKVRSRKTKPTKQLYLEIMVQGQESIDKRDEILKMLNERFKGHKIAWVTHYDENVPHTHFLISWCHPETGKALRIQRKDLGINGTIAQDVIKIINLPFTPKGQGRRHIPLREYMANPEAARKEIERTITMNEKALSFIQKMLDLYKCKLKISALGTKGGRLEVQEVEKIEDVKLKRLRNLERYDWGLYFYPADPENQRAVFLDDVKEERLKDFPPGCVVVKTSDNKYQVHVPVPEWVKGENLLKVFQKTLIGLFETDKGASSIKQLRRLAGFANQKYEHRPDVLDVTDQCPLGQGRFKTLEDLWLTSFEMIKREMERQIELEEKQKQLQASKFVFERKEPEKTWEDCYIEANYDESVADAKYAYHLFLCGFTDEEIKERLRLESKDLYLRKYNVDYYLDLTVSKVKKFIENKFGVSLDDGKKLKAQIEAYREQVEKLEKTIKQLKDQLFLYQQEGKKKIDEMLKKYYQTRKEIVEAFITALENDKLKRNNYAGKSDKALFNDFSNIVAELNQNFNSRLAQLFFEACFELIKRGYTAEIKNVIDHILSEDVFTKTLKDMSKFIKEYVPEVFNELSL